LTLAGPSVGDMLKWQILMQGASIRFSLPLKKSRFSEFVQSHCYMYDTCRLYNSVDSTDSYLDRSSEVPPTERLGVDNRQTEEDSSLV
jgi:hypothetical protein